MAGLEPARAFYGPTDFKSVASTISPHRRFSLSRGEFAWTACGSANRAKAVIATTLHCFAAPGNINGEADRCVCRRFAVILAQILAHRFGFPVAKYMENPLGRSGQRLRRERASLQVDSA